MAVRRVLVDWDYGASGLWRVLTPEELKRRLPIERWQPWSEILGPALLGELRRWNVRGEVRGGRARQDPDRDEHFWSDALVLAERVQEELGDGYEVLCRTGDGAWRWMRRPTAWA